MMSLSEWEAELKCSATGKNQEMKLIFELGTLKPNGLNINFSFI